MTEIHKATSKNQATFAAGWPVAMKTPAVARDRGGQQDCPDEKEAIFRGAHKLKTQNFML